MPLQEFPNRWHFARWACSVAECADELPLLLKQLKKRAQQAGDPLFGLECIKQDKDADVCFHPIDVERATQCLMTVLHVLPPEDSPAVATCFDIGKKNGCHRWMTWRAGAMEASWILYKQDGAPSSLEWEQELPQGYSPIDEEWTRPWRQAAEILGIESLLQEAPKDGLLMPELIGGQVKRRQITSDWSNQTLVDVRGFKIIVACRKKNQTRLRLAEADPAHVDSLWLTAIALTTQAFGSAEQQLLNITYNGKQTAVSEQLNAASPLFHTVIYNRHDNERDKFYRDMLKPLTLPAGTRRVFPAIALERDGIHNSVFMVNVVRTNEDCWLEFQAEESLQILPWIQQTLGGDLEVWKGPAEGRWGW